MSCEFIKSHQDRVLWVPVGVPHTKQRLVAGLCHARSSWFGIGALNSLPMSALGQKRWREQPVRLCRERREAELADLREIKAFPSECP